MDAYFLRRKWLPKSEAELLEAYRGGMLEERNWCDVKREVDSNVELARRRSSTGRPDDPRCRRRDPRPVAELALLLHRGRPGDRHLRARGAGRPHRPPRPVQHRGATHCADYPAGRPGPGLVRTDPEEAEAAQAIAEVVIRPAAQARSASAAGTARLYLEVPVPGDLPGGPRLLAARTAARLAADGVAGVILRPAAGDLALARFLSDVAPALTAAGVLRGGWSGTLRERLSLPQPAPLAEARPAFPGPVPLRTPS
jgi:hypothetical protein